MTGLGALARVVAFSLTVRAGDGSRSALVKETICRLIAAMPACVWPIASRLARTVWPGFGNA